MSDDANQKTLAAADGFPSHRSPLEGLPDPTPEMLMDPLFSAIWDLVKNWDVYIPTAYSGYMGATGNHVRAIFDVIAKVNAGQPRSVMQDWTHRLTFMQQTVLLTAVRGPDGLRKNSPAKPLLRAYRRTILLSSLDGIAFNDPHQEGGGSFMAPLPADVSLFDAMGDFIRGADEMPHHFYMHVAHAAEIVGYKHPNRATAAEWFGFYTALCNDLHMEPEPEERLDYRLGDSREQWLASQRTAIGDIIQ